MEEDGGRGKAGLPEKLGGGVWPTSQNSNPLYDQNLRFCYAICDQAKNFIPYIVFMTIAVRTVVLNIS